MATEFTTKLVFASRVRIAIHCIRDPPEGLMRELAQGFRSEDSASRALCCHYPLIVSNASRAESKHP